METGTFPVPEISGSYVPVYRPQGDTYLSASTAYLEQGRYYADWIPNDFCTMRKDGRWHLFGITHPAPPDYHGAAFNPDTVHAGEWQLFHAVSEAGDLGDLLYENSFRQAEQILSTSARPGERPEIWAPDILQTDSGDYLLLYTPDPFRYAVSRDLYSFTPAGPLFCDGVPNARDINVLRRDGVWLCIYCSDDGLMLRSTTDFRSFTEPSLIRAAGTGISLESPVLKVINGIWYLFTCPYDGNPLDAYCHKTYVYAAESLQGLSDAPVLTVLDGHAPEIVRDEAGNWFILSVAWPHRGVSMARLNWRTSV